MLEFWRARPAVSGRAGLVALPTWGAKFPRNLGLLLLGMVLWGSAACVQMSNKPYVASNPGYRGIQRVAVFLRHWPCHRAFPGQPSLSSAFISGDTVFFAPLQASPDPHPRAVDLADFEELVADTLLDCLRNRGYEPVLLSGEALVPSDLPLADFLSPSQILMPGVDAYLFGFYSPTLYVSDPDRVPPGQKERSYFLEEMIRWLNPGRGQALWAGPSAVRAPGTSISHAAIHMSLTLFRARDGGILWQVADSRVAGRPHGIVARCPPFPSREDYWATAGVIRRLMRDNLKCRLHFLIPEAIPPQASSP